MSKEELDELGRDINKAIKDVGSWGIANYTKEQKEVIRDYIRAMLEALALVKRTRAIVKTSGSVQLQAFDDEFIDTFMGGLTEDLAATYK